ncbi:MAG: nucleoid-associated protein [Flavobacteriaceae bacterium]
MFIKDQAYITQSIVHKVGNKALDEDAEFSADRLDLEEDDGLYDLLMGMNTAAFQKQNQYFNFNHNTHLNLNEVYTYCKNIFDNPENFIQESAHICAHLYEQSNFPQIKKGDVLITQLSDILFEGELVQALVILKIERKSSFFQTTHKGNHFGLKLDRGIDPSKIDKGCMVFNTGEESGYKVISVDFNRYDAAYWKQNFLNITASDDAHAQTKHFMDLCKSFSDKVVKVELGKQEQVNFLNDSVSYIAKQDTLDTEKFEEEVTSQAELKAEFSRFREEFEKRKDIQFWDEFEVSPAVFTQERKKIKSEIKLDTGIDLKILEGGTEHLEKFYDQEKGMHYYKVYFNSEL